MKSMLMVKIEREFLKATRSLISSEERHTAFRSYHMKHGREKHPSVLLLVSSTSVCTFSSRSIEGLEIPTVRVVCAHFGRPLRPAEVIDGNLVVMVVGRSSTHTGSGHTARTFVEMDMICSVNGPRRSTTCKSGRGVWRIYSLVIVCLLCFCVQPDAITTMGTLWA